jgi:hypothetical protein
MMTMMMILNNYDDDNADDDADDADEDADENADDDDMMPINTTNNTGSTIKVGISIFTCNN